MENKISIKLKILIIFFLFLLIYLIIKKHNNDKHIDVIKSYKDNIIYVDKYPHEETLYKYIKSNNNKIPYVYQYKELNLEKLKHWLNENNSYLAQEPYFSAIVESSKIHNLNPCLLFAITGKEQSLVPKNHPKAAQIANNPFNVFGSWKIYNTNIRESADIACKTIIKISADRPDNIDFLHWLNSRDGTGGYAEDTEWCIGVGKIFQKIYTYVS